ncbi:MAG: DUF1013 domain-containing protein [Proteobacteria bacterium]|nr:DUF1013 domain-containing protein [Pseudomonadota bacterium]
MAYPLMPKATAVWLVESTALTFDQISKFCGLHELEVQAIADGEVATGIQGLDPIAGGELTQEELDRCTADPGTQLVIAESDIPIPKARSKGARYTPISKRQDRPDAIAWILRNHPELSDAQISKLIGTTKPTINAIRERSHWNMPNIKPQNPIGLGLCFAPDLEKAVALARSRAKTAPKSTAEPIAESKANSATESGTAADAPAPEAAKTPKPGDITLLKGEPKKAPVEPVPVFAAPPAPRPSEVLSTPEVLRAAEDIFAPRPAEPPEATDEPAPEPEREPPPEEADGKKEADATPGPSPEEDAS